MPTTPHKYRALTSWGPVIVYCGAIFAQSSFSTPSVVPSFFMSDKLEHIAAYAVMAILFYRAFVRQRVGASPVKNAVFAIACTVLYGISDEVHQSFVPARSAEVFDVIADAVGALAGVLIASRFIGADNAHPRASSD